MLVLVSYLRGPTSICASPVSKCPRTFDMRFAGVISAGQAAKPNSRVPLGGHVATALNQRTELRPLRRYGRQPAFSHHSKLRQVGFRRVGW
jgi:hypothetical protein